MSGRPLEVFEAATKTAAARANSLAAELSIDLAGIKLGADMSILVTEIVYQEEPGKGGPCTVISSSGKRRTSRICSRSFMKADLSIYPLTATETHLDSSGVYEPTMGSRERHQRHGRAPHR